MRPHRFLLRLFTFFFAAGFFFPLFASATTVNIGNGNRIFTPLQSIKAMRDQGVVKQGYDYSCAAAALATLLTYGLDDPLTEEIILRLILEPLAKDQEQLRKKQGLSLADLQSVVLARGHKAQGFRLLPEYLPKLKGPVIVFIKPRGYEHFAVLKGIRNDRVYLADPSLGNVRMPVYQFLDMWMDNNKKGIVFVVERKDAQWAENTLLKLPASGLAQPEILTARQMLEVGDPYLRFPLLHP
jgi:predicted double-glycine peptidase